MEKNMKKEIEASKSNIKKKLTAEEKNILQELDFAKKKAEEFFSVLDNADLNKIKNLDVDHIIRYSIKFAGNKRDTEGIGGIHPFKDALLTLSLQQAVNNFKIETPLRDFKSRFNICHVGDRNTGKSFVTRDFLVGNDNPCIPIHGIPFVKEGVQNSTPASFIMRSYVLEKSTMFNWIYLNDEYSSWLKADLKFRNNQKSIMNGELVSWELKSKKSIPPFNFRGCFICNYNEEFSRNLGLRKYNADVTAIMSRMFPVGHEYTLALDKYISKRKIKFTEKDSKPIRDLTNVLYFIGLNLKEKFKEYFPTKLLKVKSKYPMFKVVWNKEEFEHLEKLKEEFLVAIKSKIPPENQDQIPLKFGTREFDSVIKIISGLAVYDYFKIYRRKNRSLEKKVLIIHPNKTLLEMARLFLYELYWLKQPEFRTATGIKVNTRNAVNQFLLKKAVLNKDGWNLFDKRTAKEYKQEEPN